ncbi:MarR family winged helix-turn-helix transcriptional regulator [Agromyces sp. Marseille-P2726]|uniref:MarR family winged helix-turn-helix transcriptional regulator n=1 Tax=Agromyces sp. Marseille-P2726 TaxID=2709132 RepID=UPI00156FAC84|nr:MarR family transcriptional regulator [Agromyces sp. Marseille-P2726]
MTDVAHTTLSPGSSPATSARRPTLAEQSSELRIAIMRLARRLRQERTETELSASQFSTLGWISSEGPLTIGRLADLERVTAPSMNRTVNCLVDAGYATRATAPDDGRKVLVSTTESGEAIIRETRRRRDAWLAKRFAALTPAERETLADATTILGRIIDQ